MFQSIWDEVKREFQYGTMVTRIIITNVIIFIIVTLFNLVLHIPTKVNDILYQDILRFFSMPSDGLYLLTHPWTLFTSGFLHEDVGHIFWNMVTFYWFGRIVGDWFGDHRVLPLYISSVIFGNIIYFLMYNFTPYGNYNSIALGASGAVMAMLSAAAYKHPDYSFNIIFIGNMKLKFVALALFVVDLIGIAHRSNTGGHFSHIGGALFGILYVSQLNKGIDLIKPVAIVIDYIANLYKKIVYGSSNSKRNFKTHRNEKAYAKTEKNNPKSANREKTKPDTERGTDQERVDIILDKIKQKGYESLTAEEREFLFKASKKE